MVRSPPPGHDGSSGRRGQWHCPRSLAAIIAVKFRYFEPNRKFPDALTGHEADLANPLSPFGPESRAAREQDLAETDTSAPDDTIPHLPKILWM